MRKHKKESLKKRKQKTLHVKECENTEEFTFEKEDNDSLITGHPKTDERYFASKKSVSLRYQKKAEVPLKSKKYFVCMLIQSKNKKMEAKIFSTTHPFLLVYQLNTTTQSSTPISTQKLNYEFDENSDYFKVLFGDNGNISEAISNNISLNGSWEIELIIGPFDETSANEFTKLWTSKSRGIDSRRERGLEIFREKMMLDPNLKCYNKHIIPLSPPIDFWLDALNIDMPDECKISNIIKYYSHLKSSMTLATKGKCDIDKYEYEDVDFLLKIKGYVTDQKNEESDLKHGVEHENITGRNTNETTNSDIVVDGKIVQIIVDTSPDEHYRMDVIKFGSVLSHTFCNHDNQEESREIIRKSENRKYKRRIKENGTIIEMKIPCILCTDESLRF